MVKMLVASMLLALGAYLQTPEHTVSQKGRVFSRSTLTLRAGERIVFKNDDNVTHNVFSSSEGFAFNLRTQAPGTSGTQIFTRTGTAEVRCAFHPTMKLTVTVR